MCKDVYNDKKEIIVKKKYGKMFIAMEGTDNIKDWINNLSFMFKKNDKHSGFTRYANHCKEQYNIKNIVNKNKHIIFTGHSLGAASTLIMCNDIINEQNIKNKNIEIVLFGSPKVGGKQFTQQFNTLLEQNKNISVSIYKHNNDIVCSLPLQKFGYHHITNIHQIHTNKKQNCIEDHNIMNYIEALT
jgi:predicted lipase